MFLPLHLWLLPGPLLPYRAEKKQDPSQDHVTDMNRTNEDEIDCAGGEAQGRSDQYQEEKAPEVRAAPKNEVKNDEINESSVGVKPILSEIEDKEKMLSCPGNSTDAVGDDDKSESNDMTDTKAASEGCLASPNILLALKDPALLENETVVGRDGRDEGAILKLTCGMDTKQVVAANEGEIEKEPSNNTLQKLTKKKMYNPAVVAIKDMKTEKKTVEAADNDKSSTGKDDTIVNKAANTEKDPSGSLLRGFSSSHHEDNKLDPVSTDGRTSDVYNALEITTTIDDEVNRGKMEIGDSHAEKSRKDHLLRGWNSKAKPDEESSVDSYSCDSGSESGSSSTNPQRNLSKSAAAAMSSLRKRLSDAKMKRLSDAKMNRKNKVRDVGKDEDTPSESEEDKVIPVGEESAAGEEAREKKEHEEAETKPDGLLPKLLRRENKEYCELAHELQDHTYSTPTNCDVCSGLLVGLWSQGLRCRVCGLNVHRGEGINDHDDCRASCLLTPCSGPLAEIEKAGEPIKLREAFNQVRQIAKESPTFLKDVRAQMDKDIKSHAKHVVVKKSAEAERSKKLRRLRAKLVPFVEAVDAVEAWGEAITLLVMLLLHIAVSGVATVISLVGFIVSLWPWRGPANVSSVFQLAMIHNATVIHALHVIFFLLALLLRRATYIFKRKAKLFDQFLRDVVKIDAEEDLGISVDDFATRARSWSNRVAVSAGIMCVATFVHWHNIQPPIHQIVG